MPYSGNSDLYDMLAQSDPETLQAMIDAGLADERSAALRPGMAMGYQMASQPGPQGNYVGRTYVASSPLEHLASGVQKAMGYKMMNDAAQRQAGFTNQKGAGLAAYLRAVMGGGQPPAPNASAPQMIGADEGVSAAAIPAGPMDLDPTLRSPYQRKMPRLLDEDLAIEG